MFPYVLLKPWQESSDSNHLILCGRVEKFSEKNVIKFHLSKEPIDMFLRFYHSKQYAVFSNYDNTYSHQKAKQNEN